MHRWRVLKGVRAWWTARSSRRPAPFEKPVIGLALGGGFARGLAHVGVLKVLEENQIPIHAVAGVSVGAFIGGAYCAGMSVEEMIDAAGSVRFGHFARWTLSRLALASNAKMEQLLERYLHKETFEELRIPLAVIATDITDGEQVVFRSGNLIEPIRASCAYPGLFLPVQIGERTLIDGGFSCAVPTAVLAGMGATHIIAVHLICNPFPSAIPTNIFQMVGQCFALLQKRAGSEWRQTAQCIIEPPVTGHSWDSFDHAATLIAAGEQATRAMMPRIRGWLPPHLLPALTYSRQES